jgi:hypothetical protein
MQDLPGDGTKSCLGTWNSGICSMHQCGQQAVRDSTRYRALFGNPI